MSSAPLDDLQLFSAGIFDSVRLKEVSTGRRELGQLKVFTVALRRSLSFFIQPSLNALP